MHASQSITFHNLISVGSEMTFKLPAYNPVYISEIAVGNDGTHLFRRSIKLNNTTVSLPIKGQQYISSSTSGTRPKVPVKSAADDKNVYIAENGEAATINGKSMKPLYGTTINQSDSEFASAYDNEENVWLSFCEYYKDVDEFYKIIPIIKLTNRLSDKLYAEFINMH